MSIFHVMSVALALSPIVTHFSGWFFPYSFLGFTLFFLALLRESRSPKLWAWFLWISGVMALVFAQPLWYQSSLCLFLAAQVLHYGLRHSQWYAQISTLAAFFACLGGVFYPLSLYGGAALLIFLLLITQKKILKEAPLEP